MCCCCLGHSCLPRSLVQDRSGQRLCGWQARSVSCSGGGLPIAININRRQLLGDQRRKTGRFVARVQVRSIRPPLAWECTSIGGWRLDTFQEQGLFLSGLIRYLKAVSLGIVHNGLEVRSNKRTQVIQEGRELVLGLELPCLALVFPVGSTTEGTRLTSLLLIMSYCFKEVSPICKWTYKFVLVDARYVEI